MHKKMQENITWHSRGRADGFIRSTETALENFQYQQTGSIGSSNHK